jgi:hypothetical protein
LYRALVEDWYDEDVHRQSLGQQVRPGTVLNLSYSLTYLLVDFIEFISRLGEQGLYKQGVVLHFILHNVFDRKLRIDQMNRSGFMYDRITKADKITLNRQYPIDKLITGRLQIANELALEVMDSFSFNPDASSVLNDQKNYARGIS